MNWNLAETLVLELELLEEVVQVVYISSHNYLESKKRFEVIKFGNP